MKADVLIAMRQIDESMGRKRQMVLLDRERTCAITFGQKGGVDFILG